MILKIFRYFLCAVWIFISSIITFAISLIFPFKRWTTFYIARIIGWPIVKILGIKINYQNYAFSNDHPNHPCIYASNHQANWDLFIIGATCPYRTVSLGKRSIIYFPFFGLVYWLSGQVLINRSNKSSAHRTMGDTAKIISEQSVSIWIMPEGTRSKGRGLLPFKKGAFYTAIEAKVPIVPVSISHYANKLDLSKWVSGEIDFIFHEPLSTEGFDQSNMETLVNQCRETIKNAIE